MRTAKQKRRYQAAFLYKVHAIALLFFYAFFFLTVKISNVFELRVI